MPVLNKNPTVLHVKGGGRSLGKKVFLDPVLEKIISDFTGKKLSNEGLKPLLQDEKLVSKGKILESVG